MIVVNLYAGPGTGKSTSAAALFAYLKTKGIRAELVGEYAKDLIYEGREHALDNQFLLAAMQYTRLKNLERSGCEVAISDSPLLQQMVYHKEHQKYRFALQRTIIVCNHEFDTFDVFLQRRRAYDTFGRINSEEEAKALDAKVYAVATPFDFEVEGTDEGRAILKEEVLKYVQNKLGRGLASP